ncbi:MAG: Do family serine endopeptidase [Balneolaceae bacterium]|nr:Do family serine endopeptidase [Balneolaceae bacterium]
MMHTLKKSHIFTALLAVLLVGFYTFEFSSGEASLIQMPDFVSNTDISPASQKPVGTLADFNDAIVDVATKTRQAVVSIEVTQTVERPQTPMSRFFDIPENYQRQGLGSGVIVSQDGYILTNNHVVAGASSLKVHMQDGSVHEGEIIGRDPRTDIAVVKIDAQNLTALAFGDSEQARVGEMVLAIGSPLNQNLAQSVSMGIISAKERSIGILRETGGYENFIQTDAAINPGNSGGALVNMDGELIGVNSAIASASGGGNDGIGFAVPSNLARYIMESLIEHGEVRRGYLGIQQGGQVDATMARALGLERAQGVIVGSVEEGTPAEEAGLQEGDVVISLNDNPVRDWMSFRSAIGTSQPGDTVILIVNRDGEEMEVEVTLGELPDELQAENMRDQQQQPNSQQQMQQELGFGVDQLTARIAQQLNLPQGTEGVLVSAVRQNGQAAQQGLQRGDVITRVNSQAVTSTSELQEVFRSLQDEGTGYARLRVLRPVQGGSPTVQFIALEL